MANELYKSHLVIWNAKHGSEADVWFPAVTISWQANGKYKLHQFKGPAQISYNTALQLAKTLAEAWVDENPVIESCS